MERTTSGTRVKSSRFSMEKDQTLQISLLSNVNFYIKEYFERSRLDRTNDAFVKECQELNLPIGNQQSGANAVEEDTLCQKTIDHAVSMFEMVYEDAFFKVWDDPTQIPHVHDTSTYLKLNFRLHIYFCCRKISENLAPTYECLQNIREFFDREGTALSNEHEFIHFFALPFVSEPQNHSTFKILFEESTWIKLRSDLENYLNDLQRSDTFSCQLVRLVLAQSAASHYDSADNQVGGQIYQQIVMREQDALKMRKNYSKLMANHQQLRKDYQKLIAVTKELTSGLEMVAKATTNQNSEGQDQQTIEWDSILSNCSKIYPELFPPPSPRKSARRRREFPKLNEFETCQKWEVQSSNSDLPSPTIANTSFSSMIPNPSVWGNVIQMLTEEKLNFIKIKSDLQSETVSRRKLLLMQSMRWLLTKISNGERSMVMEWYLRSDILGLYDRKEEVDVIKLRERIMTSFLPHDAAIFSKDEDPKNDSQKNGSHMSSSLLLMQQNSMSRFVNAMASLRKGREYLGSFDPLIETMIDCLLLLGTKRKKHTAEMIVATLQKLSLKCLIRKKMIDRGVIDWLITYLKDFDSVNSYGLEYSTALLMNLCLHRSAKEKCIPMAKSVLETLAKLVSTCSKQILPYVNGTLYSLLNHSQIAEQAKNLDLEKLLEEGQRSSGDKETRQQISFILDQINKSPSISSNETNSSANENTSTISEDEDDDTIDEDIDIEEEVDADDPVIPEHGEVWGAEFLEQHYFLDSEDIMYDRSGAKSTQIREVYMEQLKTPKLVSASGTRNSNRVLTAAKGKVDEDSEALKNEKKGDRKEGVDPKSSSSDEGVVLLPSKSQNVKGKSTNDDSGHFSSLSQNETSTPNGRSRGDIPPEINDINRSTSGSWKQIGKKDNQNVEHEETIPITNVSSKKKRDSIGGMITDTLPKLDHQESNSSQETPGSPDSLNNSKGSSSTFVIPWSDSTSKSKPNSSEGPKKTMKSSVPLPPVSKKSKESKESKIDPEQQLKPRRKSLPDPPDETGPKQVLPPLQSGSNSSSAGSKSSRKSQARPKSRLRRRSISNESQLRTTTSRANSAAVVKRTMASTYPYSPLSNNTDAYNSVFAPKPRVSRSPPQSATVMR